MKKILLLFVLASLIFTSCQHEKKTSFKFPAPIGFVNDYEHIFIQQQVDSLTSIIKKHQDETTNQISIVTIRSFAPYKTLSEYSLGLFNTWGIGTRGKNNGIAIVFGRNIKQIRITVGVGLEQKLKDEEAKQILDNTVIPEFKKNDFYTGIRNGLLAIIEEIK